VRVDSGTAVNGSPACNSRERTEWKCVLSLHG
jgi:hypothetical protein